MEIKKIALIASLSLSAILNTATVFANGSDLSISNSTTFNLSFMVNGKCSSDFGVVRAYTIKSIPKFMFKKACKNNPICEVMAFDKPRCTGKEVGGVKYYFYDNAWEMITGNVEHITITGGLNSIFYSQKF